MFTVLRSIRPELADYLKLGYKAPPVGRTPAAFKPIAAMFIEAWKPIQNHVPEK